MSVHDPSGLSHASLAISGDLHASSRIDEAEHGRRMARIARLERVLDRQFRLPVIGDVGLDGLLGLLPGIGDAATAGISGYLMLEAHRAGARRRTLARMAGNVGIDFVLGLVPVVGDVADFFHKANTKNLALLRRELETRGSAIPGAER